MATIRDIFFEMHFGKHKGKTVGEVFEEAPDYLLWAHGEVAHFNLSPELLEQVKTEVARRKDAYKKEKLKQMQDKGLIPAGTPGKAISVQELFGQQVKKALKDMPNPLDDLDDEVPF